MYTVLKMKYMYTVLKMHTVLSRTNECKTSQKIKRVSVVVHSCECIILKFNSEVPMYYSVCM